MKYNQARKIESKPVTAWLVTLPSGQELIEIWAVDTHIEDVHNSCLAHHGNFKLQRLDVGSFVIHKVEHTYIGDARSVNQDYDIDCYVSKNV